MKPGAFYFDPSATGTGVFLGPTEAALMELAWTYKTLTVKRALYELHSDTPKAYTTIMTILNRLAEKGLLRRHKESRCYVYHVAVDRQTFLKERIKAVQACLNGNFPEHT